MYSGHWPAVLLFDNRRSTYFITMFSLLQVDIEHLKVAICQAVDVMQAMGSAIRSLFSQVNRFFLQNLYSIY